MGFIFTKIFWGCFLVLWGLSLVLEKIIGKNIPIGRFFVAFFLIYFGIYLIARYNKPARVKIKPDYYAERNYGKSGVVGEYSVVFGNNIIDLSSIKDPAKPIEVNTVFGTTELILAADKAYQLRLETVFGGVYVPNHGEVNFGTNDIQIGDEISQEKIIIDINTVFGKTNIIIKKSEN